MDLEYGITLILVLAVAIVLFWLISPYIFRKKKWYRIERADGKLFVLYRTRKEMWRNDILRFKDEAGHEYTFHWHWITVLEEISEKEVAVVRAEIENARRLAEEDGN